MIDIILGIVLAFGFVRGLMKGFIVEIASLIALIIGVYGAIHFSYFSVDILQDKLSWSTQSINIVAFILTFIIIVLGIMILAKLFTKLSKIMAMSLLNRLLGGIFGLLKMAFILGILLIYFNTFNQTNAFVEEEKLSESVLYHPIEKFGSKILPSVMEQIKTHNDWFDFNSPQKTDDKKEQKDELQEES